MTSKVTSLLAPPPGGAVPTEIRSEPTLVRLLDGIVARSSVPLTNVVASGAPSSCTIERGTKLFPVTMIDGPTDPTVALFGAMELTSGEVMAQLVRFKLNENISGTINRFLSDADLVKFAKYQPVPSENEGVIPVARVIVDSTKPSEAAEQTEDAKEVVANG